MNHHTTLLIADDDTVLAEMLSEYLAAEGYEIKLARDGLEAMKVIRTTVLDLVVLDIMMPNQNGIDTLKQLRGIADMPVIMLTARGDDLDRILGLELGADDYVSKPCNPRELLARIKAVLRRTRHRSDHSLPVTVGDVTLDPRTREVSVNSRSIPLTQTEFDLLHLLLRSPGEVITKQVLSTEVLGKPLSQWDRSIDVHISNLRKKLSAGPDDVRPRIRTLRGTGYLFVMPETGTVTDGPA